MTARFTHRTLAPCVHGNRWQFRAQVCVYNTTEPKQGILCTLFIPYHQHTCRLLFIHKIILWTNAFLNIKTENALLTLMHLKKLSDTDRNQYSSTRVAIGWLLFLDYLALCCDGRSGTCMANEWTLHTHTAPNIRILANVSKLVVWQADIVSMNCDLYLYRIVYK